MNLIKPTTTNYDAFCFAVIPGRAEAANREVAAKKLNPFLNTLFTRLIWERNFLCISAAIGAIATVGAFFVKSVSLLHKANIVGAALSVVVCGACMYFEATYIQDILNTRTAPPLFENP